MSTPIIKSKNLSPQQLAALAALAIALPTGVVFYFVGAGWKTTLMMPLLLWAGSYFLILYLVQQFIYRKIKLIYKLIYQTKASKREEFYYNNILPVKSIDEVQEDVEDWALQKKIGNRSVAEERSLPQGVSAKPIA